MARVPDLLFNENVLVTPQNAPLVMPPVGEAGPDQLKVMSLVPQFSQYIPVKRLRFTGRGQTISFFVYDLDAQADSYYLEVSPPIPFQCVVRLATFMNKIANIATMFYPCYAQSGRRGIVTTAQLQGINPMFQFGNESLSWLLQGWPVYGAYVPIYANLNFLMPATGYRVALLFHNITGGSSLPHAAFECLEVVGD